jgi:methionyl-tRNA formyltransferase
MKIGFVTAVYLGLDCLEVIVKAGLDLSLLITLDDQVAKQKSGRIFLDDFAAKHGVPLQKTKQINNREVIKIIQRAELDYLFVVG